MVVLNLRDDCVARAATNFRRGMTDKRFLELEITAWLGSKERKRQLAGEAYYDGAQDVLRRKRIALDDDGKVKVLDHLPNNRLVNNIYAKMVDQKPTILLGGLFSFDTENKAYAAALSTVFGSRFQRTMHNIGEGAWIGGKSWVFPYYDQNGELAFQRFPADEVLPFWADADHTILDAAVHVYVVLGTMKPNRPGMWSRWRSCTAAAWTVLSAGMTGPLSRTILPGRALHHHHGPPDRQGNQL